MMAAPKSDASESGAVVVPSSSLFLLFQQETQREVWCVRLCMHRHISVKYCRHYTPIDRVCSDRALLHSSSYIRRYVCY
jgi:hypothetical protein